MNNLQEVELDKALDAMTRGEQRDFAKTALKTLNVTDIATYTAKLKEIQNRGKGYPLNVWCNYIENYNKKVIRDILIGEGFIVDNYVTAKAYIKFNLHPLNAELRRQRLSINDLVIYEDNNRIWINPNSSNYQAFCDFIAKQFKILQAKTDEKCKTNYNNSIKCGDYMNFKRIKKRLGKDLRAELSSQGYKL